MRRYAPQYRAEPRGSAQQRVLSALVQAPGAMAIADLERVAGLTRLQCLTVLDVLVERGAVRALGDLRYGLGQGAA